MWNVQKQPERPVRYQNGNHIATADTSSATFLDIPRIFVASRSWWLNVPPTAMTETAYKELPRMQQSNFAAPGSTFINFEHPQPVKQPDAVAREEQA